MPTVRPSRRPCGVTLIELILTLVVLAVLVAVLAPVMSTGINAYIEGRRLADRERQASLALERLVRDLRAADSVDLGGDQTLTLNRNGPSTEYSYAVSDGELLRDGETIAAAVDDATDATFFFETEVANGGDSVTLWSLHLTIEDLPPYQATGRPRP
ncbi:MAG: prepilin-type N-terminal cleavage/methylation domain-containing protein [Ectothiorhodospiraceae bacterium]